MVGFVSGSSIQFPDLNFCGWEGGWMGCLIACFTNTRLLLISVVVVQAVHRCYDAAIITLDSWLLWGFCPSVWTLGLVFLSREEWNCNCYALPCIQCIIHDTAVFTVLILPLCEHRRTFHILMSSSIPFFNVPSFYYKLCYALVFIF